MIALLALAVACAGAAEPIPPPAPPEPGIALTGAQLRTPEGGVASAPVARLGPDGVVEAERGVATIPVADAPALEITAARTRWDLAGGRMALAGAVTATRGDVTLTCDEADVRLDAARRVERVEARGHVIVTQGARVARASRAVLEAGDGRITLTGDASLADGRNRMAGEPLVIFLDDDRVECDACRLSVDASSLGTAPPGAR